MEKKEIDQHMKGIASTSKKCPHCRKPQSNLWNHLKTCCGGKNRLVVSKKGRPSNADKVTQDLMGAFKQWSDKNPRELDITTRNRHIRYTEEILAHFDATVRGFNSEQLMSNVNPPELPDIERFLSTVESKSMKSV